jgi:hypothetical protein
VGSYGVYGTVAPFKSKVEPEFKITLSTSYSTVD